MLLLFFAFLSGLVTILAPCIWPILPIVLSASVAGGGGRVRSVGITLGVMSSFTVFTLTVSALVRVFGIDPVVLRLVSVGVLVILAVMMIVPRLAVGFELLVGKLANVFGKAGNEKQAGFWPGFLTGVSLGGVWSPCAGPILAAIATLAATGGVGVQAIAVTIAYVAGVGVPLFAFSYGGQAFLARTKLINRFTGKIQQVFGVVMLVVAVGIYFHYDVLLQAKILERLPGLAVVTSGFEKSTTVQNELRELTGKTALPVGKTLAPEFVGIERWLNTQPLTMAELRGKVVLIDFWTYTCINCIRTLPHVTSWYNTYKDKGFVVVGVHTPEFAFEKETANVQRAIQQFGILYPVAQDNNYATWNAYQNLYWPAKYLIDAKGVIRYTHFGEGEYDKTEDAIRALLIENGQTVDGLKSGSMSDDTPRVALSPETYLGSRRMLYLDGVGKADDGVQQFRLNPKVKVNHFSLDGQWNITPEAAISGQAAVLEYEFVASRVFLVMRPPTAGIGTVHVWLDGEKLQDIVVDTDRLYDLVKLEKSGQHRLRLEFSSGIGAFAFTFG